MDYKTQLAVLQMTSPENDQDIMTLLPVLQKRFAKGSNKTLRREKRKPERVHVLTSSL